MVLDWDTHENAEFIYRPKRITQVVLVDLPKFLINAAERSTVYTTARDSAKQRDGLAGDMRVRASGEQAYILHQNAIIMQRFEYALLVTHAALEPVSTSAGTWNLLRNRKRNVRNKTIYSLAGSICIWNHVIYNSYVNFSSFRHRRAANEDQIVEGGILIEFFGQYCLYLASRIIGP